MRLVGCPITRMQVVGGIYVINISRFENGENMIWYFSLDTLERENLSMKYLNFITWTAQRNVSDFYASMRWDGWRRDCKKIEFNIGCLIYSFLWAKKCNKNIAQKKIVLFDELMHFNFYYLKKL